MDEVWRDIPGTLYRVSNEGRVTSFWSGKWKVLRPAFDSGGYLVVGLCSKGSQRTRKVHQLVAEAFLGPRPSPKHQVNHSNGTRSDNRSANLEWVTPSGNQRHRFDVLGHGGLRGEMNGFAKLAEVDVHDILRRCAAGESRSAIAADYGVCKKTIFNIATGKKWGWLTAMLT